MRVAEEDDRLKALAEVVIQAQRAYISHQNYLVAQGKMESSAKPIQPKKRRRPKKSTNNSPDPASLTSRKVESPSSQELQNSKFVTPSNSPFIPKNETKKLFPTPFTLPPSIIKLQDAEKNHNFPKTPSTPTIPIQAETPKPKDKNKTPKLEPKTPAPDLAQIPYTHPGAGLRTPEKWLPKNRKCLACFEKRRHTEQDDEREHGNICDFCHKDTRVGHVNYNEVTKKYISAGCHKKTRYPYLRCWECWQELLQDKG